jgi:hypothetical protein
LNIDINNSGEINIDTDVDSLKIDIDGSGEVKDLT